jgi:hypothetical protein
MVVVKPPQNITVIRTINMVDDTINFLASDAVFLMDKA